MNFYMDLLVNIIIQRYFVHDRCVMILVDGNNSVEYMGKTPVVSIKLDENLNFDRVFHYFGCKGILVKSDRPAVFFESFEKEIRLRIQRLPHRKYLFVPGIDMEEDVNDIFNTTAINYVTDMIVLQETNSSVLVWTNKYVGTEDNNQKILLDEWYFENHTFLLNNHLYPDKLLNQMGRVLRLGTVYYEPYSIFKDTDNIYDNKGSELKPLLVYSRKHNVTPLLVISDDEAFWGDLYDNWTGTGLLGNLLYDKVDVAFGALYMLDSFYPYVDWSKPTLKSGVTVLVPTPKILAGWLTPIHAYNPTMWLVLLVMFVVSVFLLHLLHCRNYSNTNRSHRLDTSTLSMIKMFLMQGVSNAEIPSGAIGKYFMLMMFIFEVFLSSSYGSGFASIMTVPTYEKPVDTVRDLAESEVAWGANTNEWVVGIRQSKEPDYIQILQNFYDFDDETLTLKSYEGNFGFSIERLPNNEFAVSPYIARDVINKFRVMQDDLDWQQCVVMFRKNSVLLPSFDKLLMRIIECGLISHWQSEGVYLYMDSQQYSKYSNSKKSKESNIVKLKLTHVVGAFAMLCFGCVSSTLVFILDILYDKRPMKALLPRNLS